MALEFAVRFSSSDRQQLGNFFEIDATTLPAFDSSSLTTEIEIWESYSGSAYSR